MPFWMKSIILSIGSGFAAQIIIGDRVRHKDYIEGLPLWANILCDILLTVSAASFMVAICAIMCAVQDNFEKLDERIQKKEEANRRKRGDG